MKKIGFVGCRGLVGTVLLQRMLEEGDFLKVNPIFFTTSQEGKLAPNFGQQEKFLYNAFDYDKLITLKIIVNCHGSNYTNKVYLKLRKMGWNGYWVDSSFILRMKKNSIISLDPVNINDIKIGIEKGIKDFIIGNCTVNLLLIALGGLFEKDLIEWISISSYQAVSGAGSYEMYKFLLHICKIFNSFKKYLKNLSNNILFVEKKVTKFLFKNIQQKNKNFDTSYVANLIPWIDKKFIDGRTKEEWKLQTETNKILNKKEIIPIDGTCVRIGALRCHSQSLVIKMKKNISIMNIKKIISSHNKWVKIIPNEYNTTLKNLTPVSVSGTLNIPIGRIRKLNFGKEYLSVFTVGDQLLWGAAEPLRRILKILIFYL